jgi:dTDP-4-dehydrorhamnose 3,5-epimerase
MSDLKVVLYDTREKSATYKKFNEFWLGEHGSNVILKIPPAVAHGCLVVGERSELFYVTSSPYNPKEEERIPHDDPTIGYDWFKKPEIK